jgi:tRNA nucleotidyltransferase/poly(A) polymerase
LIPKIPASASRLIAPLARRAEREKTPLYVVGGAVRDWLLGRATYDLDFLVEGDARPLAEEAARLLKGRIESFDRFGTLRVKGPGRARMDFAAARRESYPEPAALPVVERPVPIAEDLRRRDFTVNAIALRLSPGPRELFDPFKGAEDLDRGIIRVLHDQSFRDDPTRVFRAARYLCRFGLKPAPGLVALAGGALAEGHARKLSPHRLAQELLRVLDEPKPACALRLLKDWGYLDLISPALSGVSKWPNWSEAGAGSRLAELCVLLGPAEGTALLKALPIDRHLTGAITQAIDCLKQAASPRVALPALAEKALRAHDPSLSPAAVQPVFLRGADLEKRGLTPGPDFRAVLDDAARLQWRGRLKTRREALSWLASRLKK